MADKKNSTALATMDSFAIANRYEGIDPELWERLKRAAYGSMVRRLNSLDDTCFELAQAHFDGEHYLTFPQVFQSIERADGERLIREWCAGDRAALSVIRPLD